MIQRRGNTICSRIFRKELKKKKIFQILKKSSIPIPHLPKHSKSDSNFLEIRCTHRWRSGDLTVLFLNRSSSVTKRRIVVLRPDWKLTQTKQFQDQVIYTSSKATKGGEKKKKKNNLEKRSLKRELCPTLRTTNGRQSLEHRRGRGTRRFPRPEKATMSKRRMQGFISYPQPSRTRWSILGKSDNKRLAGLQIV